MNGTVTIALADYESMVCKIKELEEAVKKARAINKKYIDFDREVEDMLYHSYKQTKELYDREYPCLSRGNKFSVILRAEDILKLYTLDERYAEETNDETNEETGDE